MTSETGLETSELKGLGEPGTDEGDEREYDGLLCKRDRGAWAGLGEAG